jgi:dTDP-4-dehydrorhamnose reductase
VIRWAVLGAGGMLGSEVVEVLEEYGYPHTPYTRQECDLSRKNHIRNAVRGHDVVVNCAAWTDVDGAEKHRMEAEEVNAWGPARIAEECRSKGLPLLHVSSDYALSGTYGTPIPEDAPHKPVNAYGHTKALGEQWVRTLLPDTGFVVRTAWLYGRHGRNFVDTMARLAEGSDPVRVVNDQWGQPTWARSLAERLIALGEKAYAHKAPGGVYHGTSQGRTTWHGLARAIFQHLGHDPARVVPVTSEEFTRPAARPTWSVLAHDGWHAAGLSPYLGNWRDMLDDALSSEWFSETSPE